jgi:hypothetical protein
VVDALLRIPTTVLVLPAFRSTSLLVQNRELGFVLYEHNEDFRLWIWSKSRHRFRSLEELLDSQTAGSKNPRQLSYLDEIEAYHMERGVLLHLKGQDCTIRGGKE